MGAEKLDKFTGADLTEICQRAAKIAIRESIQRDMEREKMKEDDGEDMDGDDDPVPEITREHFEEAMAHARRSVSDQDLMKYSAFAQSMQQQRAAIGGVGANNFRFPQRGATGDNAAAADDDDDEDLYS